MPKQITTEAPKNKEGLERDYILSSAKDKEPQATMSLPPQKKSSFREEAWETVRFLFIAFAIVVPIRIFIAQPFIVSGASMDPTFKNKQYLIVDELSYHLGNPERGDVAVFKYPKNPKQYFIKRVIGLPGETVVDNQGQISIKNKDGKTIILITHDKDVAKYAKRIVKLRDGRIEK